MIKLLGSLLLAVTGLVLAVSISRFEQKKLRVIDSFISLIFHIKGQIDCYSLPLCDILRNRPSGLELLDGSEDLGEILYNARIYLDTETYRLLESFYTEFGGLYRDEQLKRCEYYIEALGEQRRALFEDLPARTRIGSALCICSTIGILIILW